MGIISDNLRHIMLVVLIILLAEIYFLFASASFVLQPQSEGIQQSIRLGNAIIDTGMCFFNSSPSHNYVQRLLL